MDVGDDLEALVNIGQIQGPRRGRRRNARPPDALVAIADPAAVEVAADAPMLPADPDDGLAALVAVGNVERVKEKCNQRSGSLVEKARNTKTSKTGAATPSSRRAKCQARQYVC